MCVLRAHINKSIFGKVLLGRTHINKYIFGKILLGIKKFVKTSLIFAKLFPKLVYYCVPTIVKSYI